LNLDTVLSKKQHQVIKLSKTSHKTQTKRSINCLISNGIQDGMFIFCIIQRSLYTPARYFLGAIEAVKAIYSCTCQLASSASPSCLLYASSATINAGMWSSPFCWIFWYAPTVSLKHCECMSSYPTMSFLSKRTFFIVTLSIRNLWRKV